jgi:hypothetical protein
MAITDGTLGAEDHLVGSCEGVRGIDKKQGFLILLLLGLNKCISMLICLSFKHCTFYASSMNELGVWPMERMGNVLICSTIFIPGNLVFTYENRCDRNRNDGSTISDQASKERT